MSAILFPAIASKIFWVCAVVVALIAAAWFAVGGIVDFKESAFVNREFRKIVDFEIELVKHSCVSAS